MEQNNRDEVVIVNEKNEWLGVADKLEAHKAGLLHRAFSVFILNDNNELLIQKRAGSKYHSGGLWSNTCCSHPRPDESTEDAVHRRLKEELGFDCPVKEIFTFRYCATVGTGITENEYDHIFLGYYDGPIQPNEAEIETTRFVDINDLLEEVNTEPGVFTVWFRMALPEFVTVSRKQARLQNQYS